MTTPKQRAARIEAAAHAVSGVQPGGVLSLEVAERILDAADRAVPVVAASLLDRATIGFVTGSGSGQRIVREHLEQRVERAERDRERAEERAERAGAAARDFAKAILRIVGSGDSSGSYALARKALARHADYTEHS